MKKLILLLVLMFCLPSFGDILVYQISTENRNVILDDGDSSVFKQAYKAYIIIDTDTDDPANGFDNVYLIVYGRNAAGEKVKADFSTGLDWDNDAYEMPNGDYGVYMELWGADEWDFDFIVTGTAKLMNIGFGANDKRFIASILRGDNILWEDPFLDYDLYGASPIDQSLQLAITKDANKNGDSIGDVFDYLFDTVLAGYDDITP